MGGAERTLAGRYALTDVIGRGGMATVYRARDLVLGRIVAVKILSPALVEQDARSEARFEREARVVARLSHPGIVKIFDSGTDGEQRFIVMEHVAGRSLAARMRESGRLPVGQALDVTRQIADALAAIHAAGLVHRDLKPSNAMIDGAGKVKLLDFGIAFAPEMAPLTQTSTVLGSAPYMAPEQASGARGDVRSDIYSLGCLLYALLEGAPPFAGESAAAVLHQHLHEAPRKLSSAPGLPAGLEALVMQMLAKRPQARPAGAAEIRDRLAAIAARASADEGEAPTVAATPTAPTLAAPQRAPAAYPPARGTARKAPARRSSRRLALPMAAAAAAFAGAAALVLAFALHSGGPGNASGANGSHGDGSAAKAGHTHVSRASMRHSTATGSPSTSSTGEGSAAEAPAATQPTETNTVAPAPATGTVTETEAPTGAPAASQTPPAPPAHAPPGHDHAPPPGDEHSPVPPPEHGDTPGPVGGPPGHGGGPPGHGGVPPGHGGVPPGHDAPPHGHGEASSDWHGGWSRSEN